MMLHKLAAILYNSSLWLARKRLGLKKKSIVVDGFRIVYLAKEKKDKSKTFIFIHGLNEQKEFWLPLVSYLNPNYQTILIDLLGSGESDKPYDFDYSLRSQANFLDKVIRKIIEQESIERFTLVGDSMGGGLAILIAKQMPLEALVLVAPLSINKHKSYIQELAKKLGDVKKVPFFNVCSQKRLSELTSLLFYNKPKTPRLIADYIVAKKCAQKHLEEKKILALIDSQKFDFLDDLSSDAKEIKVKTLIVWGVEDKVLNYKNAKEIAAFIAKAKVILLERCGHMVHLEKAKKLALLIDTFLEKPIP